MNIWAIVAVFAALIFGGCIGFIVAYRLQKKTIDDLCENCRDTTEKLNKISSEYEEFMKSACEESRWPKHTTSFTNASSLTDYLKNKYLLTETEFDSDCEDESDNLYV